MDKIMTITCVLIVLFTLVFGAKAMHDLNDGRVATVVNQLVNPSAALAETVTTKRK